MELAFPPSLRGYVWNLPRFALTLTLALAFGVMTGCGSGGGGPQFSGNTSVSVLISSTANDQLSEFGLQMQSLNLVNQMGEVVPVLTTSLATEFIHVNGLTEPLVTVTIPQGVYKSATATIGSADFECVTIQPPGAPNPGSLTTSIYAYGFTPNSQVTVNLPSPMTITGDAMGLMLNLQVSQSASFPSTCYPPPGDVTFSITPTFNLTPVALEAQPTVPADGKITEMEGQVSALGTTGNSFTLSLAAEQGGRTVAVGANSSTVYQGGIGGFSALQVGALVDMDGAVQPDGSVLATRIASYDPTALNVMIGPLLQLASSVSDFFSFPLEEQGQTYSVQPQSLGVYSYSGSTSYQISGQFRNMASLPFAADFSSGNMSNGQNVAIYSQQITDSNGGDYTAATTITLMPQTINGTVTASSPSGGFTDYTVSLAAYDLFPTLVAQVGQALPLKDPSTVEVYIDGNTQLLNTQQALANGSTLRFYGIVFNDDGILRMDCASVNDGVPFATPLNSSSSLDHGEAKTVQHPALGGRPPVISTVTRAH